MLISARSGMDSIIYAADSEPKEGMEARSDSLAWRELRARTMDSLVVVCEPVRGWLKDDDVCILPKDYADCMKVHNLFCSLLSALSSQLSARCSQLEICHAAQRRVGAGGSAPVCPR
jgi:hypothetical protein